MSTQNGAESDSGAFTGIFRLSADTERGAPGPLAAPLHCGSADEYLAAIRWRYANCPGVRQQLVIIAWRTRNEHAERIPVLGPFAAEAKQILEALTEGRPLHSVRAGA